jgi:hypothetical protein
MLDDVGIDVGPLEALDHLLSGVGLVVPVRGNGWICVPCHQEVGVVDPCPANNGGFSDQGPIWNARGWTLFWRFSFFLALFFLLRLPR